MEDLLVGRVLRSVRLRRRLRQPDVARLAGVSASAVSRAERGHFDVCTIEVLRRIARVLDVRLEIQARWRGGELDRLVNARHAALHESAARLLRGFPGWSWSAEVTFAIYGERGVIDILAWHPGRRALLIIELKTDMVDPQEVVGSMDRRRRLARRIAAERGLDPLTISCWVIVAEGGANRRRVAAHTALLGRAFPLDGRSIRTWLREPQGTVAALSFLPILHQATGKRAGWARQRVRRPEPQESAARIAASTAATGLSRGQDLPSDHPVTIRRNR